MSDSALFNALKSNGRQGAPDLQSSDAPVAAGEGPSPSPSPVSPLFHAMQTIGPANPDARRVELPDSPELKLDQGMHDASERLQAKLAGHEQAPSPMEAEMQQGMLGSATAGMTSPGKMIAQAATAPLPKGVDVLKQQINDLMSRPNSPGTQTAVGRLTDQINRLISRSQK